MAIPASSSGNNSALVSKILSVVPPVPNGIQNMAKTTVPLILGECSKNGVTDLGQIAYIIATAEHESRLGMLMIERQWVKDEAENNKYFEQRYGKEKAAMLGNTQAGDGPKFKGRGFVQITGRVNYSDWSKRTGQDLIAKPELAADPKIAAVILVVGMKDGAYTKKHRLDMYISGDKRDFLGARRIVNGQDRAQDIADIATRYYEAITS